MAPPNDQLSWMDYISHSGRGGPEGLSPYHSAWDPGGASEVGKFIMVLRRTLLYLWLRIGVAGLARSAKNGAPRLVLQSM